MNTDLNMDVDEDGWLEEHAVYCPISWCTAHKLRRARCGDKDGDYVGIHVARLEYAKKEGKRMEQALRRRTEVLGLAPELAEFSLSMDLLTQQAVDTGLVKIKGIRKGRRRL